MKNQLDNNLNLKGKRVLLRVDLNVPMNNGSITETSRIEKIIPTIKLLIEKQAKIIILSHIGRPKGEIVEGMSLEPISKKLASLLNKEVLTRPSIILPKVVERKPELEQVNEDNLNEVPTLPMLQKRSILNSIEGLS